MSHTNQPFSFAINTINQKFLKTSNLVQDDTAWILMHKKDIGKDGKNTLESQFFFVQELNWKLTFAILGILPTASLNIDGEVDATWWNIFLLFWKSSA